MFDYSTLEHYHEALAVVKRIHLNASWYGIPLSELEDYYLRSLHTYIIRKKKPNTNVEKKIHKQNFEEATDWDKAYNYAYIFYFQEKIEEELKRRGIDFEP